MYGTGQKLVGVFEEEVGLGTALLGMEVGEVSIVPCCIYLWYRLVSHHLVLFILLLLLLKLINI